MITIGYLLLSPFDYHNFITDTFITSFGIIHLGTRIIIDPTNCFYDHAINRNNPDIHWHNLDFFTYISSERYTLDKFYEIVIDTEAFILSTAKYRQYFTYK